MGQNEITSMLSTYLLTGVIFCILCAIFVVSFLYKASYKQQRLKKRYDEISEVLASDVRSLQHKFSAIAKERQQFTEVYLDFLVSLLQKVEKFELVNTPEYKTWEGDLVKLYKLIQVELRQLSIELYAENKKEAPLAESINNYILLLQEQQNCNFIPLITTSEKSQNSERLFPILKVIQIVNHEKIGQLHISDNTIEFSSKISDLAVNKLKALAYSFKFEIRLTKDKTALSWGA